MSDERNPYAAPGAPGAPTLPRTGDPGWRNLLLSVGTSVLGAGLLVTYFFVVGRAPGEDFPEDPTLTPPLLLLALLSICAFVVSLVLLGRARSNPDNHRRLIANAFAFVLYPAASIGALSGALCALLLLVT